MLINDIFGRKRRKRQFMKFKNAVPLHDIDALQVGGSVVRVERRIGRYCGLTKIAVGGMQREVLKIEYRDGIHLFVKLENVASVRVLGKGRFSAAAVEDRRQGMARSKHKTKDPWSAIHRRQSNYAKQHAERGIIFSGRHAVAARNGGEFPLRRRPIS